MTDSNAPIRGKCTWWREHMLDDDRWDITIKEPDKRVECSCFVEGKWWEYRKADVPTDCPLRLHCRYYIKSG